MDYFYIIVLTIAVVLLILILTYVGLLMKSTTSSQTSFPPTVNSCPDYWTSGIDLSSCAIPATGSKNIGSIYGTNGRLVLTTAPSDTPGYKSNNNDIVFSSELWSVGGSNTICKQKTWANKYGIQWDGISNFNGC